jgi:SNF2 family DNA or RNA helicase
MAKLQPAGLLGKIASFLFPKKLEVQVRTEQCSDGTIELTPVYLVDGKEIEPRLITESRQQTILGYNVEADDRTLSVCRRGRTRVTKRKAAEYLKDMQQQGIRVRSKDGRPPPVLSEVKPEITLTLNPDDSLEVASTLATAKGEVVEKPVSLEQLSKDDGWYLAGENFVHVETTGTDLDNTLLTQTGPTHFTGNSVPETLKKIDSSKRHLGPVEKSDNLKDLAIYGDKSQQQLRVDGDADAIHVRPTLVWLGKNKSEHELKPEDIPTSKDSPPGFRRIPEGWIAIDPKRVADYQQASIEVQAKIGDLEQIEGTRIPETLVRLLRQDQFHSPWTVYFSQAVKNAHRVIDTPAKVEFKLNVVDSDGRSLLQLDPIYNHERFQVTHNDSDEALTRGEDWIRRRDAWVKIDRDKYKKIESAIDDLGLQRGATGFTFPASQREKVIQVFSLLGSIEHSQAYADFLLKLADFDKIEDVPLPTSLRGEITLRPYQKHGYNWLAFLHRFGLNGVLADDMGLGKTLQTLAVIQKAKELNKAGHPSLIICPTSVIRNWEAEVRKFFSGCVVVLYTGARREAKFRIICEMMKYSRVQDHHATTIVVTSYDIARRDCEELNRIPWMYVVVDEGHNIKNPDAQRTKAIKTINGQHKLALTGTPIQNNLEELWSLFDFVMPSYLGTRKSFKDLYGRNGRVNWDVVREGSHRLRDRLHPFILRRMKEHVAKDLPPKIIVDRKVELTPVQVDLYKKVLASADCKRLVEEIDAKGVQRAKVLILSMFTKLRAICNHPALSNGQPRGDALKFDDSGKLDCLQELMEEIIDGEHRALLFCQSTQMLDIIGHFFTKWRIRFLRLDGETPPPRRQGLVDEFNGTEEIKCFLISTKAGGTGLNLTGADTVIFYDHDWNPANDNQAQDRAYRIGQTKPVTVYKLISKGTIEEKIIERQGIKQTLADEIIGADEQGFKDLTKDELMSLFQLDESDD